MDQRVYVGKQIKIIEIMKNIFRLYSAYRQLVNWKETIVICWAQFWTNKIAANIVSVIGLILPKKRTNLKSKKADYKGDFTD